MSAPAQELLKLDELHLFVDLLLLCLFYDAHLAHAVAVGHSVLIVQYPRLFHHQLDTVTLGHVLLPRRPHTLIELIEVTQVSVHNLVCLIVPPDVVSELLPLRRGPQCEAIVLQEHR